MLQESFNSRQIILVTGAAKSGKSEWAERQAKKFDKHVIYLATALEYPNDPEWQAKIEQHRRRRPAHWTTLAVPYEVSETISSSTPPACLLVDSLGTWVANLLERDEAAWHAAVDQLMATLKQASVDVILVAEETGWGVVPAYSSGRQFRDRLGDLIRHLGAIADTVYLVTGGYVLNLSLLGEPLGKD